jgi:hypothetical protein
MFHNKPPYFSCKDKCSDNRDLSQKERQFPSKNIFYRHGHILKKMPERKLSGIKYKKTVANSLFYRT